MDSMGQMGDKLTGIIKGMAAAWASWKVIQYARDAATLAARYETLGVVMGVVGNNAGYTRAQMDAFAMGLEKTGISMVGARDSLTMMAGAQMDLTKSSQMARMAQDAAVIGNINSSEAFQRMVQGIRSGETEILRTIGISVNFEQAYQKMAGTLRKTSNDLTDTEKLMARQNVVMEYGSKIAGAYEASMTTVGKQLLSMQRYAEDLQTVFGSVFSEAFGTIVQSLNQALQDTKKWLVENAQAAETMRFALGSAAKNFVGLVKDVLGVASSMANLNSELTIGEILTGGLALAMAGVRDTIAHMLGIFQMISGALTSIFVGSINFVTTMIGKLAGFKPPAWMDRILKGAESRFSAGVNNMKSNAVGDFYTGGPAANLQAELDKSLSAMLAKNKAEQAKIKAGNDERAKSAALAALAKAQEEAAKAAEAYAKTISGLNIELTKERINLEQGAVAAYKFGLMTQGVDRADREALGAKMSTNDVIKQTIELEKKLIEGRKKLVEINPDIANGLFGSYRDAMNLGDPTREAQAQIDTQRASLDKWRDTMPVENYQRAIQTLASAERKLRAEHGDIWAGMGMVVESYADQSAEALANFFNGTKTGFSDMIRSILLDMEKLILKQQILKGLGWAQNYDWGKFFGGSGSSSGGGGSFDWSNPDSMPSMANPSSGSSGSMAPIIVNISTTGEASVKGGDSSDAKKLGALVGAKVREVITQERRSGGLLNPV